MRSAVIETHSATKKLSDQLKRAAAAAKSVKNGKTTEMKNKREVTQMETEDCNDLQVFLDKGGMDDTFLQYVGEGFWVNEAGRTNALVVVTDELLLLFTKKSTTAKLQLLGLSKVSLITNVHQELFYDVKKQANALKVIINFHFRSQLPNHLVIGNQTNRHILFTHNTSSRLCHILEAVVRASIVRCGYQQVLSTDERDVAKYEKLVAKSEVVSETLLSAQMNISNYGIVDLAHFKESVEKQTRIFKEMATLGRTNRAIKALFWNKSNPESNAPLLNLVVQSIESNFIKLKEFNKRIASIVEDNSRRQLKLRLMHKTGKIPLELRKLTKVVELNSFHQDLSVEVKRISLFLNYLYKCLRLLLYMISDAGVASGRGRLFFEKDYDIIYISTLLITGTFGNEIEYDGSFDTLCKDKYFTSTITRVLLPAESALVKIKTMSVLIMTEFCDMVNIDTGSGSKVRLQFEDLFLRWKNVNGEQGLLVGALQFIVKTLHPPLHPNENWNMNPAVFKNQVSAAPTANTEKKDAREVARAFQCARLISYYLKLDKQVVLSPVWQQAPSVYKLLSSKTSELSNLNDITARPISILKDNFMEEFKYLLSNPTILHPLRQGVVQHIPPQFEQGTAALFSRLDKLLQYLTREIVAA